jgi:uncharacterized coiled-coil protein SlyX
MRRCSKCGGIWRGCARWRPPGRRRWSPSGLPIRSSARGSRRRRPSRARLRSGRARLSRGPRRPTSWATLDAKVAALAIAEDQLLQERTAHQGAEGQLQQEQTALADARSALERERTAREAAQKSLEERNVDFSKLEGELVALSITSADQEQSLKEQSATVVSLQQAVEAERRALEVEKKQVTGRSPSRLLFC